MWIRCRRAAVRAWGWMRRATAVGSHGVAAAALTLALAAVVAPWLQDPASLEIGGQFDLTPRGAWIVTGAGLVALALLGAVVVGATAAGVALLTRATGRVGFAIAAVALVGLQLPWMSIAAVGHTLASGRQPLLSQVEALLPAGPYQSPLLTVGPIRWPVARRARVTSGFGWRMHPLVGAARFHNGIDIAVSEGTPILAATDGVVIRAGDDPLNGLHVVVMQARGIRTAYCHLSAIDAEPGSRVRAGDVVGLSGQTGRATGPHLHFGAWVRGRAVDPRRLLAGG